MIISKVKSILNELIFLLFIIFNIISGIIRSEFKNKRRSDYSIFILINNVNTRVDNREDILLINENNNSFEN